MKAQLILAVIALLLSALSLCWFRADFVLPTEWSDWERGAALALIGFYYRLAEGYLGRAFCVRSQPSDSE